MAGATLEDLRSRLEEATSGLAEVSVRKAFGSFGFFVRDAIFALAYRRELRIGVKLPDDASQASLLALEGAAHWAPHTSPMRGWVLVPEAWHDDLARLRPWVRRAYEQVARASEADDVPSMGDARPSKRKAKGAAEQAPRAPRASKNVEPALPILHRGATQARAIEKPAKKKAAAASKKRKHSGR